MSKKKQKTLITIKEIELLVKKIPPSGPYKGHQAPKSYKQVILLKCGRTNNMFMTFGVEGLLKQIIIIRSHKRKDEQI